MCTDEASKVDPTLHLLRHHIQAALRVVFFLGFPWPWPLQIGKGVLRGGNESVTRRLLRWPRNMQNMQNMQTRTAQTMESVLTTWTQTAQTMERTRLVL